MKTFKALSLIILFALTLGFVSCDNDHDISIYGVYGIDQSTNKLITEPLSEINITILYGVSIQIRGGKGDYTITTDHPDIIRISDLSENKNNSEVMIAGVELGETMLHIKDESGNSQSYAVSVKEDDIICHVVEVHNTVNVEDVTIDGNTLQKIIEKDLETPSLPLGWQLVFTFEGKQTGTVQLKDKDKKLIKTGTFLFKVTDSKRTLNITYEDETLLYTIGDNYDFAALTTKTSYPTYHLNLKENLTGFYKNKYPEQTITRVISEIILSGY